MRVRKFRPKTGDSPVEKPEKTTKEQSPATEVQTPDDTPVVLPEKPSPKNTKSRGPAALLRRIAENPNFNIQLMVIILSLASENVSMDRRIDSMSSTVDKIRNITDVINNTMQSVKVAAEAPKQIRRLFDVDTN